MAEEANDEVIVGVPGRGPLRRLRSATSLVALRRQDDVSMDLNLMVNSFQVAWGVVQHRLERYPAEARQRDDQVRGTVLYNALSRRVADYPPIAVVRSLIRAYPQAVEDTERSPLQAACRRRASLEILEALMAARSTIPQDCQAVVLFWGSYNELMQDDLVAFLRGGGREACSILIRLERLLQYCMGCWRGSCPGDSPSRTSGKVVEADGTKTSPPLSEVSSEWLALHAAARLPLCPPGLVEALIHLDPNMISFADSKGWLPLHYVASIGKQEIGLSCIDGMDGNGTTYAKRLEFLLQKDPSMARRRDRQGALPLHIATRSGLPVAGLKLLALAWPDALCQRYNGLFPAFLSACCPDATLDDVFFLVSAFPNVVHHSQR